MVSMCSVTLISWIKQWRGTTHFLELSRLSSGSTEKIRQHSYFNNSNNRQSIIFKGRKRAKQLTRRKTNLQASCGLHGYCYCQMHIVHISFSKAKKVVHSSLDSYLKRLRTRIVVFKSTVQEWLLLWELDTYFNFYQLDRDNSFLKVWFFVHVHPAVFVD